MEPRPQGERINNKELIGEMTNKIQKLLTRLIKKEKINIIKTEKQTHRYRDLKIVNAFYKFLYE